MAYKLRGVITSKTRWKTLAAAKRNAMAMRKNARVKNVKVVKV